jgi:protoheme IX farnesyltransferase
MRDYLDLTKPRITWLILVSTAVGCFFGARESWTWTVLLHALAGTGLMASGTAALNQWYERAADGRMRRTAARPIPSGRVSPPRAFWFGVALSAAGFVELGLGANWLTAALGLFTLLSYLLVYTPLKSRTPHSTSVGAIPGAMPPLMGYAAMHGALTPEAWTLYAILFLWQFPHFLAIAWMYREDYARGGIRMLPVVAPDGESTARAILITAVLLVPVSLLPQALAMTGKLYLVGATLLGAAFVVAGARVTLDRSAARARKVLLASVAYLPALYALMVLDRR